MEMQCSIGLLTNEECHKNVYGNVLNEIRDITEFTEENRLLISYRVCGHVTSMCNYHKIKYLQVYHHLYGRYCSDPLNIHKKAISKGLREIKIEHMSKQINCNIQVVPGKSLCPTCFKKVFLLIQEERVEEKDQNFTDCTENLTNVDAVCSLLGVSPASKIRKISYEKRLNAITVKIDKVSNALKRNLETSFHDKVEEPQQIVHAVVDDFTDLIHKLKEKCSVATKDEKVKIISLLPNSWSRQRISTEFKVSERLVRLSKNLSKDQGILPEIGKKKGHGIPSESVALVHEFYESDEYSRMCPGKKECISIKINNIKVQKQKRLILCNLNELFTEFKEKNPECKIGRSKFIELRPKWCVLAGSSGTHTVCVCVYHQNVKLMIDGAKLCLNYKELLDVLVCDLNSYNCMMGNCINCPGEKAIKDLFQEFDKTDMPENIIYKQWVSTDRAEMVTLVLPVEEYFDSLIEKLLSLKTHHYIAKTQSQFLKERKDELTENECIVILDFAENFTFICQDEIQAYHWTNQQATVHPFVCYYKHENKLFKQCFCVISDELEHNTLAVHLFQTHLLPQIKKIVTNVNKVIYFSDGAVSQYKNRKNFTNICQHKTDFGVDAEWHFFAAAHGKNTCDGVGGTTKRVVSKVSLQRPAKDFILNAKDMFEYCKTNIKGIKYIYLTKEEIDIHKEKLRNRFDNCQRIPATRKFHRCVPISESKIRCYETSRSEDYNDFFVVKAVPQTFRYNDIIACMYDEQWWIGIIMDINLNNKDAFVKFYNPAGPAMSFKLSKDDTVWVPFNNILRKISHLEFSTATGRCHNISVALSNEISLLAKRHRK